ncbi:60S ribosomal protein L21-2 [Durusdinium trenchii]|uniref:60S ribosomal protein L21-2 n=1 Tax=Durusdinium trenchii TaxID=1381693 RepID=A0ABP0M363_9DINO
MASKRPKKFVKHGVEITYLCGGEVPYVCMETGSPFHEYASSMLQAALSSGMKADGLYGYCNDSRVQSELHRIHLRPADYMLAEVKQKKLSHVKAAGGTKFPPASGTKTRSASKKAVAMGKTRVISKGYRHGTRDKYSKKYRTKGRPGLARYLVNFKRGDYVDIVADPSIQKGLPYSFYHGRTGIVFNVNRNALGVEMTKIVGNRQLRKRIHVRIEHVRKSRCNESFLHRVKENDKKKQQAKKEGKSIVCKRIPEGPKEMKTVDASPDDVEVLAPLPFVENYF